MKPQVMTSEMDASPEAWARVRDALRSQLGPDAFQNWIEPLAFLGADHGVGHFTAPTSFIGTWVVRNYGDAIRHAALQGRHPGQPPRIRGPAERRCGQVCRGRRRRPCRRRRRFRRPARTSTCPPRRSTAAAPSTTSSSASPTNLPMLPRGESPRAGRSPSTRCSSTAGVGLGKTHLMHAIAWEVRQTQPRGARTLPLGRAVHVPLRLGAALQGDARVQGDVPLGRHADGRRRAVHLRQGLDPGGVLPHLQRADRAAEADRHLRRPCAGRDRRARGADPLAAAMGPGRRPAPDRLRAPPRHPAGQGRGCGWRRTRAS